MLLQVALCKYHPKLASKRAESAVADGGEGPAVYEQVDGREGGVAVGYLTYDEVRQGGGGGKMNLKENKAYNAFARLEETAETHGTQ